MNVVFFDVYILFYKINNFCMILCYLIYVFGLIYIALLLFYFYRYYWLLGKDNLRIVYVCCKVCLLFYLLKLKKRIKVKVDFISI